VLLLGGPVRDFTRFLFVVVLLALGAAWIELMRRQTLHEFPDVVGYAPVVEARERLTAWLTRQREERKERRAAVVTTPTPAAATDLASRLAALSDLHARGALTDDEYIAAKARVLAGE
jgi:Short C-terminal domain